MKRSLVASAIAMSACSTPYQPAGAGGFGYRDVALAPGVYMIEVKVRPSQGHATAHQYAHWRARELCPRGCDLVGTTATANTAVLVTQQQALVASNPVAVITVQCR